MIIEFDDACWAYSSEDWCRSLIELLMVVKRHDSHSMLASSASMLPWCKEHLPLFVDYFKTRLAAAQPRINALTLSISPTGVVNPDSSPPWTLNAEGAIAVISQPLRLVLENDESDRCFLESTVPSFSTWCSRGWVGTVMGGGSTMAGKITAAGADVLARWRTFFVFDSDRLHPSELSTGWTPPAGDSCQGHQFETLCAAIPRERWHRLERRSIENYLPASVLHSRNDVLSGTLFGQSVGQMAYFYNMKKGLRGDGVSPVNPGKSARAGRSQGAWTALPPSDVAALEPGFGADVAKEFLNVPAHHPWQASVVAEMNQLSDALQDAM